jgi:hypothetical protein
MMEFDKTTKAMTDMALDHILEEYIEPRFVAKVREEIKSLFIIEPDENACKNYLEEKDIKNLPSA